MSDDKKINYNNIAVEVEGDILFVTVAKYKLFLSHGTKGHDAFDLYIHLMFTARIQKTNRVRAKDIYLRKGLNWGKDRLYAAKKLLYELNLIRKIQEHDENGKFKEVYLEISTRTTPFEVQKDPDTAVPLTGERAHGSPVSDHKCFNKESKCLNEKPKCLNTVSHQKIFNTWNGSKSTVTHKSMKPHEKEIKAALKIYSLDDIIDTIQLYDRVLSDDECYFKYRWGLSEFLKRGMKGFADKKKSDFIRNDLEEYRIKKAKEARQRELEEKYGSR